MIKLSKGQAAVSMRKTAAPLRIEASWPADTDYDLGALVLLRDGGVIHVARWRADGVQSVPGHLGVQQTGDAGRSGGGILATETITALMDDSVAAVVPFAYSAQSNGTGSFFRYQVSLSVDNGAGGRIEIDASNANDDDRVYTCVPAVLHNGEDGNVWVEPVELYSARKSENRPDVRLINGRAQVFMDRGPRNAYK